MYNHVEKSLSRIYMQYKNSPKLIQWIKTLPEISQISIEEQAEKIQSSIDIENSIGDQLDICGRIVGFKSRPSFSSSIDSKPSLVDDDTYRVLIKAKLFKNNSFSTLDEIKTAIDYILKINSRVMDGQNMTLRVMWFEQSVSAVYLNALDEHDLLPRPQGVKLKKIQLTSRPFGFGKFNSNFGHAPFYDMN